MRAAIRTLAIIALAILPLFAAAQESPAPSQPAGTIAVAETADLDQAIAKRISAILAELDGYDAVQVQVDAGIVTLTGTALDSQSVSRLDRLVSRVDGVVEIQNRVHETTELGARLRPVLTRFAERASQTIAFIPLLAVALIAAGATIWIGAIIARLRQPWDRLAPNPFIAEILRTAIRAAFWLMAIVAALDIMGAAALLSTFLGAAGIIGIAIGFAVRDTVENFISSVMLSLRQPFRPNDLVEIAGNVGRVIRLTSRATTLLSLDGNHIRIPNAAVFKAVITNYTRNPERRFIFELGVDASCELAAVRALGLETLKKLPFILPSPDPAVWVSDVGESNVILQFSGWVTQSGAEFNKARGEAIRVLKETLEHAGFGLPEPIYRIRMEDITPATDDETADMTVTEQTPPPPPARPTDIDIAPDAAFERMVEAGKDEGEPNLLSNHAPQE